MFKLRLHFRFFFGFWSEDHVRFVQGNGCRVMYTLGYGAQPDPKHDINVQLSFVKALLACKYLKDDALRKKCPYSQFFWSVFFRIRTEYGDILRISPYLVRMRENTDQKNSENGHLSRSDDVSRTILILDIIWWLAFENVTTIPTNKSCSRLTKNSTQNFICMFL